MHPVAVSWSKLNMFRYDSIDVELQLFLVMEERRKLFRVVVVYREGAR